MSGKRRKNEINATSSGTEHAIESVDFNAAKTAFLRHCRIKNLAPLSITYYDDVIKALVRLLNGQAVTRPMDVTETVMENCIISKRDEGVVDATIDRYFRGWRAFFNWMADKGYITVNPVSKIRIKSEKRIIETFTKTQIKTLLETPDRNTFTGYRDYVLMALLFDTGIRISEAEGILIPNIYWKTREIKVYGKGRKERIVPFQTTLEHHLREYISVRGPLEHDFLFVNIDNNPYKTRGMQQSVQNYGKQAQLSGVRCSPHTFRHTFAKFYIMNGGDSFSLQKILGHTSLEIVRMYVNLFSTDVAKQHRKFSPLDRLDDAED